jgi:spermidine synthase
VPICLSGTPVSSAHKCFFHFSRAGDQRDPQGIQEIAEALYTDVHFYQALYNGLSPNGILISQVGETTYSDDPYYTFSEDRHYASFISGLEELGFSKIGEYEEVRCIKLN